jgi:hypothetical protein
MSILDNLPHTATASLRVRTKGTLGGSRDSDSAVFADRPCWRQAASDAEINEFARRDIVVTDKIYFVTNPDVDARHILVIGGDRLEVRSRAMPDASVGLGIVWRVMAEHKTSHD